MISAALTFLRAVTVGVERANDNFISSFQLRGVGGVVSCMEHCRAAWMSRGKSSDRLIGLPTKWSETRWQTSLERFGLMELRRIWPRSLAAKSEQPNDISVVSANGPATQSPRSSLKFSPVTKCETSKSVHARRRPF